MNLQLTVGIQKDIRNIADQVLLVQQGNGSDGRDSHDSWSVYGRFLL